MPYSRLPGPVTLIAIVCLLAGCASAPPPAPPAPLPVTNALELARAMGNGINLGNTMEAYDRAKLGTTASIRDYETAWGQPVTTQAIISWFKSQGFDSLRIPVAWTNTMNYEKGDFTISAAYLDRVEEIIQYALNENLYVVLNDHWDGSWWGMFGSATPATRKAAMDLYVSMWTQIATRYANLSDHVIFESANEELGSRLNDKDVAKDSGTLSEDQAYATTNAINQAFVDTVRAAGGNNASRYLLIAGYNTDIVKTVDPRFVMPQDTLANRLLISVHYYTPSDYCIFPSVNRWGNRDEYTAASAAFKKMEKFTSKGYGVIIGEYGVSLREDGTVKNNTQEWLANVLDNCDRYGYVPMLWDCSSLYKRASLTALDAKIAQMYVDRRLAQEAGRDPVDVARDGALNISSAIADAPEAVTVPADQALAWIMFNASDYGQSYSVGDKYNPTSKTEGLVPTDVKITGPGVYTVALDFTGTKAGFANSVAFSAVAIANGEHLFPGYVIDIQQVLIDGKPLKLAGTPYTSSDDGNTTRVNLFNQWVATIPATARVGSGDKAHLSARLLSDLTLGKVKTLSVTFEYRMP